MSDKPDFDIAERQYAEIRDLTAKLAAAEASNARLREALEMIHRWFRPEPGWDPCKCGRCPECVSRAALEVKP